MLNRTMLPVLDMQVFNGDEKHNQERQDISNSSSGEFKSAQDHKFFMSEDYEKTNKFPSTKYQH